MGGGELKLLMWIGWADKYVPAPPGTVTVVKPRFIGWNVPGDPPYFNIGRLVFFFEALMK